MDFIKLIYSKIFEFIIGEEEVKEEKIDKEETVLIEHGLINRYPGFQEEIVIHTLHLSLGIYTHYSNNVIPLIKIKLKRVSESYVIVKINTREILWDIKDNYLYTDDKNDLKYWEKWYTPILRFQNEFILKEGEILNIDDMFN